MIRNTDFGWLKAKEKQLGATGKLDISGEALDDLSFIGTRTTLKTLDLSFSTIRSFAGLMPQPHLEYVILDGSSIENFQNGLSISMATKISIKNTPVSKIPNFKVSLLILCGENLRIIDGHIISKKLRQKAEQYPPVCKKLVNLGWMAEYPCPSEEDLNEICMQYGVTDDLNSTESLVSKFKETELYGEKNIDEVINEYNSKHQKMLQKAQEQLENYDYISTQNFSTNFEKSINLDSTSDSSVLGGHQGFSEEIYTFNNINKNNDDVVDGTINNTTFPELHVEEEEESVIIFDPNRLSYRVSQIIKKYGFDVDDDEQDPVKPIIKSLTNIFNIAEGLGDNFPGILMNGNNIVSDYYSDEESENESQAGEIIKIDLTQNDIPTTVSQKESVDNQEIDHEKNELEQEFLDEVRKSQKINDSLIEQEKQLILDENEDDEGNDLTLSVDEDENGNGNPDNADDVVTIDIDDPNLNSVNIDINVNNASNENTEIDIQPDGEN